MEVFGQYQDIGEVTDSATTSLAQQVVAVATDRSGNRAGRERHGFASLPPNAGVCMITAEKLAMQVGSAVGRSFTIEFTRDSIDVQRLSQAQQKDSYLYSLAMAGYVQFLALNWADLETTLPQRVKQFQQEVTNRYSQPRLHDYYATLMAAGAALLTWAREVGAIDELAEAAYLQRFRDGIMTNLDSQEERIAEMQFSRRFFETLATILVQKPRALVPINGYTYTDEFGHVQTTYEPPQGTPLLGWLVPGSGQIYLHDAEALKTVKRHLQDMGEFLDVSVNDLRKEMDYLGLLAETETYARKSGREVVQLTPKKKLPARGWQRVLALFTVEFPAAPWLAVPAGRWRRAGDKIVVEYQDQDEAMWCLTLSKIAKEVDESRAAGPEQISMFGEGNHQYGRNS